MKEIVLKTNGAKYKLEDIIVSALLIIFVISWTSSNLKQLFGPIIVFLSFFLSIILLFRLKISKKNITLLMFMIMLNTIFLFLENHGTGNYIFIIYFIIMLLSMGGARLNTNLEKKIRVFLLVFNILYILVLKSSLNANMQSLILLATYTIGINSFSFKQKKLMWNIILCLIRIIVFIINLNYLEFLDCRSALIAFVFYNIIMLVPKNISTKKIVLNIALFTCIVGSFIFMTYYISSWENNENIEISFSDKQFFSGRELIWSYTFDELKKAPITGIGSSYGYYENSSIGLDDSHNAMLQLLKSNGIIVFSVIIILIIKNYKYILIYGNTEDKFNIYSFVSLMILCFSESFLCDFGANLLIIFPLYSSISKINERKKEYEI